MEAERVRLKLRETPLVSVDGIADFVLPKGAFYREYGEDAEPIIEWGKRAKQWINRLRGEFGGYLRHAAVVSQYRHGQFRDPAWGETPHALDNLCVDENGREVIIDTPHLLTCTIPKSENDATTSDGFMDFVDRHEQMAWIGVTTTSCITRTLDSLIPQMEDRRIGLQRIVVSRDGFASRKSRARDEQRILDTMERHQRVIMVRTLAHMCWILGKKPLARIIY